MSSNDGGIGSTLTGGIQDISAILPLLGTEQCSEQVTSALTRGYLYAAATPMSIFGSLGVVNAGFKTLIACYSFGGIEGAKILGNMGFDPLGENLSLIMVEAGKGNNAGRYIIETRIDDLIKELNIDKKRVTGVSHKSVVWNFKMIATTALLCAFSLAPYIHLNLAPNSLETSTRWLFPVLRATGGFITATLIQLLIQRRIATLSELYLVKQDRPRLPDPDVEAAVEKKHQMEARTWPLLCLLLIGLVASVVGYVGCFSVVQNSETTIGPVSWLSLEVGLSVMRLAIWAWNPTKDDAPSLEIILELDKYENNPFPTCNKDNDEILQCKVLPLTRARDFLKIITSFAGLIELFDNPDLSLYYTLTRKRPSKKSVTADIENSFSDGDNDLESKKELDNTLTRNTEHNPDNAEKDILGERTLYITVFDHKERTTRVYTRDNDMDIFYSTKSDTPLIDVGHFLLEVEIDAKIDPKGDPVSSNCNTLDSLRKHHWSILENIQYRLGATDVTEPYSIENSWTMKGEDTINTFQRLREENGHDWKTVVEKGKEKERNEKSLPMCGYFMHSSIERERRLLDDMRGKWIERRMEMIAKETKERFQGEVGVEYRVNKQEVEKMPAIKSSEKIEQMLRWERYFMELLLLYEVIQWERLFWHKFQAFLDQIGNDRVGEKERLTREWRANCWKRLNSQMHAAVKRMARDENRFLKILGNRWVSSISQLVANEGVEYPNLSALRAEVNASAQYDDDMIEMRLRMENEIEDTKFRLKRGFDLGRFDQFWDDDTLFECRYSRSKWLYPDFELTLARVPLEIYSHALKRNKNIIHITFRGYASDSDSGVSWIRSTICDLPWVTSISWDSFEHIPSIHRDFLFDKSTNIDLIAFAEKIRPELDSDSTYIFTDAEGSDIFSETLGNNGRVLISFVAPKSDQSLILRLKHSGSEDGPLEVTLGSTVIQLNPSPASKSESSLTIDDITLYPNQYPNPSESESDRLSFEPGIRNDIIIQFGGPLEETPSSWAPRHGHFLHDVDLLDHAGLEYMPRSVSLSIPSN